ncbi:Protein CBG18486 [Caenorhabditis briggsae]|uniref:Protein CBG18486 n=3 Tax=Caenorhabditis briggsae TaxID=6238 RepID=A8XTF0_CAEBR|nr:Protein CBG18486 [Caenorhabditis briggsae]ULT97353.1 hypothetical protein L3Y34_005280 [Caenorhabditis briggsae]CAP35927.2 Protein CBG18486 [Caenorhabditis briggsae]
MTSSPTSSSSNSEVEQFLKTGDVEESVIREESAEAVVKDSGLDEFFRLRWYCLMVLMMAEFTAFTATASSKVMVFAGANPSVIGCGGVPIKGCHELAALKENITELANCVPELKYQFKSVQVEFNYVCEDAKKVKNTITIQTLGVLIGAAIFGQFSDTYGRRKALLISTLGNAIFNFISASSHNLVFFALWRTMAGVFTGGVTVVQMVFMVENIPRNHRMWIQNSITWSPNLILFPFVAWLCEDWRTMSKVIAAASMATFAAVYILQESPRWLIQKGRVEDARRALVKIRKTDKLYDETTEKQLDEILRIEMEKHVKKSKKAKKYTFIHLFCTWKMMVQSLTFITGIMCTTFIVYSLMYNMEKLSGSLYWNLAIMGAARWIINILVSLADYYLPWFGRKLINHIAMICTILALFVMAVYLFLGYVGGQLMSIGTVAAVAMCSQLFIAKYMMVNELYPTAVRNLAVSAVSTMSRIGSMFSPQLFYLSEYSEWIPYVVLFACQFYDWIIMWCFLPETKGVVLENHLPPKHKRIFKNRTETVDN